ncbi:MAG: selenocysteine synthase, partial [Acidobacteria bacterium]|nr:selenocysteine synthase [Acidobacteriota bacterium]
MFHRRSFLRGLSSLPFFGGLGASSAFAGGSKRDYFKELGVRP